MVGSLQVASLPSNIGFPLSSCSAILFNGVLLIVGQGDPTGNVPAPQGSMYLRLDGGASTTLYVKQSGGSDPTNTNGWQAK